MKKRLLEVVRPNLVLMCTLIVLSTVLCIPNAALAMMTGHELQIMNERTVSGRVTDALDGSPVPGVTVLVEGTTVGTVTDIDGMYSLTMSGDQSVLTFSFVGYVSQKVTVGNRTAVDVTLQVDIQSLEEVVVVGYGTQERAKVTGAIAQVDGADLIKTPVFAADEALQGRAPGVSVTANGAPGGDPVVRIRGLSTTGDNDPLFVVDGVIVQGLGDLNPNDVESISILKDASTTAIFGALGSNGVVMITTKNGSSGKTVVSLDSYVGMQTVTQRFDVMNTAQYLQHMDNWVAAGEIPARHPRVTDPQYADLIDNDTNWQDEIFQNARIQSHQISVAGGSDASDFRVSAGYIQRDGVLLNTGTDRFNFRANSNFRSGRFKFGETVAISFVERLSEANAGGRTAIEHALKMAPYFAVHNSDNLGGYQGPDNGLDGQDAENPVRVLQHPQDVANRVNVQGNLYGEYEILNGLTLRSQVGVDYFNSYSENFTPSFRDGAAHGQVVSSIGRGTGTHFLTQLFSHINYKKTFGAHTVDALILAEGIFEENKGFGGGATTDITRDINNLVSSFDSQRISGGNEEYSKIGYLGRLNYDYADRYIMAISYRMDASSRFGKNERWAPFYSLAAGWNVRNEAFFPAVNQISNLKLRASYGTVGNDNIGNYAYTANLNSNFISSFVDMSGTVYQAAGTTAGNPENPSLKWEQTTMQNIGIDLGLFNDQLTLSAEYYSNLSEDLLISVDIEPSSVVTSGSTIRNAGSVEVSGFELNLGYNDQEGDFKWSANLNLSTANNVVKSLGSDIGGSEERFIGGFEGSDFLRSAEGESLNHFYGLVTDGLFQSEAEILTAPLQEGAQPGDIRFRDLSGPEGLPDGVIDNFDRAIIGNPTPDLLMGFSLDLAYKGFDFNVFVNGMYGQEIYNTNIWDLEGGRRFFNAGPQALQAWTPENRNTSVPRITTDPRNLVASDRFVEDGSFTRLKNVTLGYSLPNSFLKKGLTKVRFYVSAQNLITMTSYSGLDPEVGSSSVVGNSSAWLGVDRGNYPLPKSFLGGIQVTF